MADISIEQVTKKKKRFLSSMNASHPDVLESLAKGILNDESIKTIESQASITCKSFEH